METPATELESLYEQSAHRFFACALAVTGCGGLAEDAVHNAFCRALRLGQCPDNPEAYMFRSVRNAAIDLMRKQSRTVSMTAEMIFECAPEQARHVERTERLDRVTEALQHLAPDERETIIQYLVAHLTFQEISDTRGRSMGTVTSWYRRGLAKLKKRLNDEVGPI